MGRRERRQIAVILTVATAFVIAVYVKLWSIDYTLSANDTKLLRRQFDLAYRKAMDESAKWRLRYDEEARKASKCAQEVEQAKQSLGERADASSFKQKLSILQRVENAFFSLYHHSRFLFLYCYIVLITPLKLGCYFVHCLEILAGEGIASETNGGIEKRAGGRAIKMPLRVDFGLKLPLVCFYAFLSIEFQIVSSVPSNRKHLCHCILSDADAILVVLTTKHLKGMWVLQGSQCCKSVSPSNRKLH